MTAEIMTPEMVVVAEHLDKALKVFQEHFGIPDSPHLEKTPERWTRAFFNYYLRGYAEDPAEILDVRFSDDCDEVVLVKGISFYSLCAHHLIPFHGTAAVAYIPRGYITGLSKLARLVEVYARRLQTQEQLTREIANALQKNLNPLGVAVVIRAVHLCMTSRGVEKPGSETVTSAMLGVFREKDSARAEVLKLLGDRG